MAAGWEVLQSLVRAGMNADQIRQLAQRMTGERQRLLQLGYPESYVAQLSPQQVMNTQGLPLLTGGNELNRDLAARQAAEGALGNRASAGTGLLNTLLAIEQEARTQQASPFRYGEFLADVSGVVPESAAAPIQALIEKGNYIDPRPSSILQNSRVQQLLNSLFDYSSPKTFQTEQRTDPNIGRVRDAYAKSPTDADRFFEEATRNPEGVKRMFGAYAHGGQMMADEPIVGMGMASGRPRFLVGEAGPEKLEITPTKRGPELPKFAGGGTVKVRPGGLRLGRLADVLRKRAAGLDASNARASQGRANAAALRGIDPNTRLDNAAGVVINGVRYTGSAGNTAGQQAEMYQRNADRLSRSNDQFAGYWSRQQHRTGGGRNTTRNDGGGPRPVNQPLNRTDEAAPPAEQSPSSLRERLAQQFYEALRNNPFVHPDVLARLQASQLPLPGSLSARTLSNMDQNLRNGLLTALPMAFGISPESYAQEIQRFAIPEAHLYVGR